MEIEPQNKEIAGQSGGPASPARRRPWFFVALIFLLAAVVAWIWLSEGFDRQKKFTLTAVAAILMAVVLLVRLVCFSGLRWRTRLITLASVVSAVLVIKSLFRIQGVTGDLLPIIGWRSRPPESVVIAREQPLPTPLRGLREPVFFAATTNDFAQFMGRDRNGSVAGPALARDWQARPPQLIWRKAVGPGWSGFAVQGTAALTQEQRADQELVVCYNLLTGQVVWSHADEAHYRTTIAGEGPRATPTIAGNRVYTLGATGILNCLELSTGKLIWKKDIVVENGSKVPEWGFSGSPLIVDHRVIVSAGGTNGRSLVAYDQTTGAFVWGGGNARTGYSSPLPATLGERRQVLIFNEDGIAGHDTETGRLLWSHPWRGGHPHVALPLIVPQDRVLVSSGYGTGSELLQIGRDPQGKFSVVPLWKSIRLKAKFNNPVQREGYVYGLDDGILACLDLADGRLKWKEGRYGHGQIILTGGLLLIGAEDGRVVLVEATPVGHRELTQFQALNDKTWNPPALMGEYLMVRNHKEAACYRLPLQRGVTGTPVTSRRRRFQRDLFQHGVTVATLHEPAVRSADIFVRLWPAQLLDGREYLRSGFMAREQVRMERESSHGMDSLDSGGGNG